MRVVRNGQPDADLLEVYEVTKSFGELTVLDDITFSLAAGTAAGVVGPNGSGKSTLLRCVVGSDLPDSGTVRFDGEVMKETSPQFRAAIADVLDDVEFFPDLSVVEHLRIHAWAHGCPHADRAVSDVLDELDLTVVRNLLPVTLSTGQRRRLALASCFVRPRRLLVLDEPEQRLDTAGRAWLTYRLTEEKRSGVAILLASHDEALLDAVVDQRIHV